ncbi:MAG: NTP transferase domain-containing protein [Magnetococcus sp. DMHC-1]
MISPIVDIHDVKSVTIHPQLWTAVVPAAGRGSRLASPLPKILYPILGRPILDWLLDSLGQVCSRFVFVLSPDNRSQVEPVLQERLGDACEVVIQETPTGMGDAVLLTRSVVKTPYTVVVWGDQVTLRQETLLACATLHEQRPHATLTLPSIVKENPYIHLQRDEQGRIQAVLQAREKEIKTATGENDCGLFLLTSAILYPTLERFRHSGAGLGTETREFNLLQSLPWFETGPGCVTTLRIHEVLDTLGVNTLDDVRTVEAELARRQAARQTASC